MLATPTALRVEINVHCDRAVVRVMGEAHMFTVWDLQRELNRVLAVHPRQVILDLEDLTFISSLAMGTCLNFRRQLVQQGGAVCIVGAAGPVAEALARLGVEKLFRVA